MQISLEAIRTRFLRRIERIDRAFNRHLIEPKFSLQIDRSALQEGLVSHLWQYWCMFCRDAVVASAQGALTSGGATTTSPYAGLTESEIAYISRKLSRNEPVGKIVSLAGSHLEPTWGDTKKLNLILSGVDSSNKPSLLTAFGIATSIADLQTCRNACAHLNVENLQKIKEARVRYNETSFRHPSELMFWVVPTTSDFVWRSWVDEMEVISEFAIV